MAGTRTSDGEVILPEPKFAETSLVGDGRGIPLRPDLADALSPKTEIPADPPPPGKGKLNPLFVAIPVAAIAFIAAFLFLGGKGRRLKTTSTAADFAEAPGVGEDFRG